MTLRFLAVAAVYVVVKTYFLHFMEFAKTVFEIHIIFVQDFFVLGRGVMDDFGSLGVIVIFDKARVPFNSQMYLFEEVFDEVISRR